MLLTRRSSWNHRQPASCTQVGVGTFPPEITEEQIYQGEISGAKISWGRRWRRLLSANKSRGSDGTPWASASNICINQRNQTLVEKTIVKYFRPSMLPTWTINVLPKQESALSRGEGSNFLGPSDFTLLTTPKASSHLSRSKTSISCNTQFWRWSLQTIMSSGGFGEDEEYKGPWSPARCDRGCCRKGIQWKQVWELFEISQVLLFMLEETHCEKAFSSIPSCPTLGGCSSSVTFTTMS